MENNHRFEKKFFMEDTTKQEVEQVIKLHPAVFSEIYYERFINNIYLDSFDLRNYFDNLVGISERQKVRIRWYGDLLGEIEKPVLEFKIKENDLSYKKAYPLTGFVLDNSFTVETLRDVFLESHISESLKKELFSLEGVLLNRYKRKYFQSKDKLFRFTIDSEMQFYSLMVKWNNFLNKRTDEKNIVLELKYDDKQNEKAVDFVISSLFQRAGKSSKYVSGIEKLNLW